MDLSKIHHEQTTAESSSEHGDDEELPLTFDEQVLSTFDALDEGGTGLLPRHKFDAMLRLFGLAPECYKPTISPMEGCVPWLLLPQLPLPLLLPHLPLPLLLPLIFSCLSCCCHYLLIHCRSLL